MDQCEWNSGWVHYVVMLVVKVDGGHIFSVPSLVGQMRKGGAKGRAQIASREHLQKEPRC